MNGAFFSWQQIFPSYFAIVPQAHISCTYNKLLIISALHLYQHFEVDTAMRKLI